MLKVYRKYFHLLVALISMPCWGMDDVKLNFSQSAKCLYFCAQNDILTESFDEISLSNLFSTNKFFHDLRDQIIDSKRKQRIKQLESGLSPINIPMTDSIFSMLHLDDELISKDHIESIAIFTNSAIVPRGKPFFIAIASMTWSKRYYDEHDPILDKEDEAYQLVRCKYPNLDNATALPFHLAFGRNSFYNRSFTHCNQNHVAYCVDPTRTSMIIYHKIPTEMDPIMNLVKAHNLEHHMHYGNLRLKKCDHRAVNTILKILKTGNINYHASDYYYQNNSHYFDIYSTINRYTKTIHIITADAEATIKPYGIDTNTVTYDHKQNVFSIGTFPYQMLLACNGDTINTQRTIYYTKMFGQQIPINELDTIPDLQNVKRHLLESKFEEWLMKEQLGTMPGTIDHSTYWGNKEKAFIMHIDKFIMLVPSQITDTFRQVCKALGPYIRCSKASTSLLERCSHIFALPIEQHASIVIALALENEYYDDMFNYLINNIRKRFENELYQAGKILKRETAQKLPNALIEELFPEKFTSQTVSLDETEAKKITPSKLVDIIYEALEKNIQEPCISHQTLQAPQSSPQKIDATDVSHTQENVISTSQEILPEVPANTIPQNNDDIGSGNNSIIGLLGVLRAFFASIIPSPLVTCIQHSIKYGLLSRPFTATYKVYKMVSNKIDSIKREYGF